MNQPTHLSGSLTPDELHHWLDSGKPLMLLDVMNEDCFEEGHIPSSNRACVYETSFIDQVKTLNPDQGASIVTYGTGAPSLAAQVAAEKLLTAGYTHVYELKGGLLAWQERGYELTPRSTPVSAPPVLEGQYQVNTTMSVVRWTGRNLFNHHEGTIPLAAGSIQIRGQELVGADFTLDMNQIACADLTDTGLNSMLLHHLKDADFFHVAQHPTAGFTATRATLIPNVLPGMPNYEIEGNLTLRGQTHPVAFQAVVGTQDGKTLGAQAMLELDRTQWGALYGSSKFFDRLGKHLVNDLVYLHLKIVADRLD